MFIFQKGHGAEAIWNVPATDAIISWIPLMIFAFLFGLSMDYEVFMLTRMREAYDETGDTKEAIALGLSRTGKLVTSAALVLMFAFFVLSSEPGDRHQAVRHRARGGDHLRRDRDPGAARAVDHAPRWAAGTGGCRRRAAKRAARAAGAARAGVRLAPQRGQGGIGHLRKPRGGPAWPRFGLWQRAVSKAASGAITQIGGKLARAARKAVKNLACPSRRPAWVIRTQ